MKLLRLLMLSGLAVAVLCSSALAGDDDVIAVKKVIEKAYIEGVHLNRDAAAMKAGFHEDFMMLINKKDKLNKFPIADWIKSTEQSKLKNPDPPKYKTTWDIPMVDVTGYAAVAKIEILRDGKMIYTDYMSLYKLNDGWKIVSKIYFSHK
jgi:hypothetical protein